MRFPLPIILALLTFMGARAQAQTYFSVPPVDAPQLAPRGSYGVGVRTLNLVHPHQIDILHFDRSTGKAPFYDRPLTIEIWYPAVLPPGASEQTVYASSAFGTPAAGSSPVTFEIPGKALRNADPVKSGPFPLVVVSHGYPGSRTFLSYLTENLASKGYVVAAIDHTDSVAGAVRDFSSTLLNRAADQLFTIDALTGPSSHTVDFLRGIIDSSKVAIVGYSMGGYGAITSAGAGYSKQSLAAKFVPGGYLDDWMAGSAKFAALPRNNLKAVVAIAPWGEEPPINSWDADALSAIRVPTFFIVGDQDDVSGYDPGVRQIFDGAVHSDRCMLVYENARHNVGGNPPPPNVPLDFTGRESFDEPVWRKDRITAINQHFITAFLDLYLKNDVSRLSYLHVSPEKSNNGQWPLARGASVGATFAGDDLKYWKGFERRWAVGLEMHCVAAQQ